MAKKLVSDEVAFDVLQVVSKAHELLELTTHLSSDVEALEASPMKDRLSLECQFLLAELTTWKQFQSFPDEVIQQGKELTDDEF